MLHLLTSRRGLIAIATVTSLCLALSGILGNDHHGLRQTVADITWDGFLLSALTLIVSGITALSQRRSSSPRSGRRPQSSSRSQR
jgi:hypothetical protein